LSEEPLTTPTPSSSTTPGGRRPYITMSKECIKAMDQHILAASSASSTTEFKPSSCYNDFYQTQMTSDQMTKEIGHIIEKYEKTPGAMTNITPEELTEQIMDKIKKTYKNRYYKYISAHNNNNNIKGNDA
jgi:transcriptional regulator NrdR family protein